MTQRILVIGGCGYVGSVLVPMLVNRGHNVRVVDLCWFGNSLPPFIDVVQRDAYDLTSDDLRGVDCVIFLAGLSNDPMAEFDTRANFHHNTAVPINVAFHAKQALVKRFIYASSCSVYGFIPGRRSDEESEVNCKYPYGQSKLYGERSVMAMADETFSVIALRKGTISGPSPRMRFDLIVNTMFRSALMHGVITVDSPELWRPILDIRSAANAYVRAVEIDSCVSGVFNVADRNYTVGSVADFVAEELNGVKVEIKANDLTRRGASMASLRNYVASTQKSQDVLCWEPRGDGIGGIVRRLLCHDYGDMMDSKYSNIETWKRICRQGQAA